MALCMAEPATVYGLGLDQGSVVIVGFLRTYRSDGL